MTPDQWHRAKHILAMAVEQPRSERIGCVAAVCGDDADLQAEVVSLLKAYEATESDPEATNSALSTESTRAAAGTGRARVPQRQLAAGGVWNGFHLLEEIGRGGFGVVYRAHDAALKRDVALKLINATVFKRPDHEMLLREGQLMARVRHANVVTVFAALAHGDEIGFVMELIEGRTLDSIIAESGPFSAQEASLIGIALCDALRAVHQGGLVHRDVKASNVIRESGGRVVLMDFGAGLHVEVDRADARMIGTPVYMAPEVLFGAMATPASDLYSLGVLLFYLVTGRYPVAGRGLEQVREAHRRGDRKALRDVRADLPDAFEAVVERAVATDPAQRFQSASAFRQALRGVAPVAAETTVARTVAAAPSPARVPWWALVAAPVVLLGVLGVLGFLSTMAFNTTFGRTGAFAEETPWTYVILGGKTLVAPVVYMTAAVLVYNNAALIVYLFSRISTRFRGVVTSARTAYRSWLRRTGLDDPALEARLVGALGLIALAIIFVLYNDLILAFMNQAAEASNATLAQLDPLRHSHVDRHVRFGLSLDALALLLSTALWKIRRRSRASDRPIGGSALAVLVVPIVLCVVFWVVPWRILFNTYLPVVSVAGQSCSVIGTSGQQAQVFCLGAPKTRTLYVPLATIQSSGPVSAEWAFPELPSSPAK